MAASLKIINDVLRHGLLIADRTGTNSVKMLLRYYSRRLPYNDVLRDNWYYGNKAAHVHTELKLYM